MKFVHVVTFTKTIMAINVDHIVAVENNIDPVNNDCECCIIYMLSGDEFKVRHAYTYMLKSIKEA